MADVGEIGNKRKRILRKSSDGAAQEEENFAEGESMNAAPSKRKRTLDDEDNEE